MFYEGILLICVFIRLIVKNNIINNFIDNSVFQIDSSTPRTCQTLF